METVDEDLFALWFFHSMASECLASSGCGFESRRASAFAAAHISFLFGVGLKGKQFSIGGSMGAPLTNGAAWRPPVENSGELSMTRAPRVVGNPPTAQWPPR